MIRMLTIKLSTLRHRLTLLVGSSSSLLSCLFLMMLVSISAFSTSTLYAQQSSTELFLEGRDFSNLLKIARPEKTDLSQLESISNIEIFYWYGCQSCFQVEAALQPYLEAHPNISVRRTPLIARPAWRHQANLQAIMQQLEDIDKQPSILDLYAQCISDCSAFETFESRKRWLAEFIQLEQLPSLNLSALWQTEKIYQNRAELFLITQVPTIIINETFKIDAEQAKTAGKMVQITDYLLSIAH